jgi:hypothetical protein
LFNEATYYLRKTSPFIDKDVNENKQKLGGNLLQCYTGNVVEFHTWQADFTTQVSEKPKVSKLATYQVEQKWSVTNQRHELVHLGPVDEQLIPILLVLTFSVAIFGIPPLKKKRACFEANYHDKQIH